MHAATGVSPSGCGGSQEMQEASQHHRLRWQCRRGMLELDLLLNRFLDHGYGRLDAEGQAAFSRLLAQSDQVLQSWLVGQAVPADPAMAELMRAIQAAMLQPPRDPDGPSSAGGGVGADVDGAN